MSAPWIGCTGARLADTITRSPVQPSPVHSLTCHTPLRHSAYTVPRTRHCGGHHHTTTTTRARKRTSCCQTGSSPATICGSARGSRGCHTHGARAAPSASTPATLRAHRQCWRLLAYTPAGAVYRWAVHVHRFMRQTQHLAGVPTSTEREIDRARQPHTTIQSNAAPHNSHTQKHTRTACTDASCDDTCHVLTPWSTSKRSAPSALRVLRRSSAHAESGVCTRHSIGRERQATPIVTSMRTQGDVKHNANHPVTYLAQPGNPAIADGGRGTATLWQDAHGWSRLRGLGGVQCATIQGPAPHQSKQQTKHQKNAKKSARHHHTTTSSSSSHDNNTQTRVYAEKKKNTHKNQGAHLERKAGMAFHELPHTNQEHEHRWVVNSIKSTTRDRHPFVPWIGKAAHATNLETSIRLEGGAQHDMVHTITVHELSTAHRHRLHDGPNR